MERDPPVLQRTGLSQDWTTLMFFLASLSDKGVCALVDHAAEKVKQQSGQRKAQEEKMNNCSIIMRARAAITQGRSVFY